MTEKSQTLGIMAGMTGIGDETVLTVEEWIAYCVRLQPDRAAQQKDSSLCVTPLITSILVDGEKIELHLVDGKHGAGYPRVSDPVQRAAASQEARRLENTTRGNRHRDANPDIANSSKAQLPDGYSEEEQLSRQIHHFVRFRQAFRIYSDCGVTGEFPNDDPALIKRLLEGRARRYQQIYERTMLDETSLMRRTPDQVASMRAYLDARLKQIRGCMQDEESADSVRRGRPRKAAYFRQGFTQLWRDVAAGRVHTIAASDRSRLCRAADLETEFLRLLEKHGTRLVGLIEDMSSLDVSDPLRRGTTFLIASVNEHRLEETAGHSFRGTLQLLENGHPCGQIPWWIRRDAHGFAVVLPERAALVRRIIDMSLMGQGLKSVARQLTEEGVEVKGITLSSSTIAYTLRNDALIGIQNYLGLQWPVFPPIISAEKYAELRRVRELRDAPLARLHDRRGWAEHLFTGVLICGICGGSMIYNQIQGERDAPGLGERGNYLCKAGHKTRADAKQDAYSSVQDGETPVTHHACLNGFKLAAFFSELLCDAPHLLRQAFSSKTDQAIHSAIQRSIASEALQSARACYAARVEETRAHAVEMVLTMGIAETSTGFAAAVEGICASLLENETTKLQAKEEQMEYLDMEDGKSVQAARSIASLESLQNWSSLDALSKNRLLQSLFQVIVHPMPHMTAAERKSKRPGGRIDRIAGKGYLEIHLHGVDIPLPPARMRRGPGKGIFLPTMAEWISDMFTQDGISPTV